MVEPRTLSCLKPETRNQADRVDSTRTYHSIRYDRELQQQYKLRSSTIVQQTVQLLLISTVL